MTTTVYSSVVKRPITPTMFADITPFAMTSSVTSMGDYEFIFDGDLTAPQIANILLRCSLTPEREVIRSQAIAAIATLTPYSTFVGTATLVQLTAAVKSMAGIQIGMIKVLYDQVP